MKIPEWVIGAAISLTILGCLLFGMLSMVDSTKKSAREHWEPWRCEMCGTVGIGGGWGVKYEYNHRHYNNESKTMTITCIRCEYEWELHRENGRWIK